MGDMWTHILCVRLCQLVKRYNIHIDKCVAVQGKGVMADMWVCGHIVRRVAASPLCFADFEV